MGGFSSVGSQGVGARRHRNSSPGPWEAATASATCTGKERREVSSALYHLGVSAWGHEEPPGAQPGRGGR